MKISNWSVSILFLAFLWSTISHAQSGLNCQNAGLELGAPDGYQTYLGNIDREGNVVVDELGNDPDRHRIMHITDGFDPTAEYYCTENKMLPVVPEGGGQYTMRLGNSDSGAEAERVLLSFTVTPELTFFLLSYAVVLNDPGHEEYEQPRFELRILDEQGEVFPCGSYRVRAAEEIEGFESCRNGWRVRPWTTAGFELQSYIGQTITIEILTTDCSRSGHAGYAYFDATCQPLDINLRGYCPGNKKAQMIVTEGFTEYQWNTGDTTNSINIQDPVPGTTYSVTVTSATGCTLELTKTLPELAELPKPEFGPDPDTIICLGDQILFRPPGDDLYHIFGEDLGYEAESFLLSPSVTTTYTFSATDEYGCRSDSAAYTINVYAPSATERVDSVSCHGSSDGRIELEPEGQFPPFQFNWSNGGASDVLENLVAGDYNLTLTDARNCAIEMSINVPQPSMLKADNIVVEPISCFGESDGALNVVPSGGVQPYRFLWPDLNETEASVDGLAPGEYRVEVSDGNDCTVEGSAIIPEPPPFSIQVRQDSVSCFGGQDGTIIVQPEGGTPTYSYQVQNESGEPAFGLERLQSGSYTVIATDASGCTASAQTEVLQPSALETNITSMPATCADGRDGRATVVTSGGSTPYTYFWSDDQNQTSFTAVNLAPGNYTVTITDSKGCTLTEQTFISAPPPISLEFEQLPVSCFGELDGAVTVIASGGTEPFQPPYWSTPLDQRGASQSGLAAGVYRVQVEDANGCVHMDSVTIRQPEQLVVDSFAMEPVRCFGGQDGALTAFPSGGTAPYAYNWQDQNSRISSILDVPFGTYRLTVTDANGCAASGQQLVTQPPELIIAAAADSVSCFAGSDGAILPALGGGTPEYMITVWNEEEQIVPDWNSLPAGNYTVLLSDRNNCRDTTSVEVHQPASMETSFRIRDAGCHDSSDGMAEVKVQGGTAPYAYQWDDPNGQSAAKAVQLPSGTYTVSITDANGCLLISEAMVSAPPPLELEVRQDSVSCYGGTDGSASVMIEGGTPPYTTPVWSSPLDMMGDDVKNLPAAVYQVSVTDAHACSVQDSVEVLQPDPITVDSLKWTYPECRTVREAYDVSVEGGNGFYHFEWDTGDTTHNVGGFSPGIYQLTVTDQKGCTAEQTLEIREIEIQMELVVDDKAIAGAEKQMKVCLGDLVSAQIFSNYPFEQVLWETTDSLDCDTCRIIGYYPTQTGPLRAKIHEIGPCPVETSRTLFVDKNCGTAIPNAFSPNGDGINDYFYVIKSRGGVKINDFKIFDRRGALLYHNPGECSVIGEPDCGWDGQFQGRKLSTGVYVYQIELEFLGEPSSFLLKGDVMLMR